MKKADPVKNRKNDMSGKVVNSKFRRPNVSIVYTAGSAKTQLIIPAPSDARIPDCSVNPPSCVKMTLE
jgi:hypothetical protein